MKDRKSDVDERSALYQELLVAGHIGEEYVDIDADYIKDDLRLLVGAGVAFVGIGLITAGVVCLSYYLSMYQTVGWIS